MTVDQIDPRELEQLQLERLQSTLNRAYRNVPFHRTRQNAVAERTRRDPSVMADLGEITALPFMTRADFGEHYPYGLFAVPLKDIVRIHTSPGTSVNPTVSGYTIQDLRHWAEMVSTALRAAGVDSHDILQIFLSTGLANWGRDYKDGAETMAVGVIPNTPLSTQKHLMVLRDYKTSVLVTTPGCAMQLVHHMERAAWNPTLFNLKRIILVGQPVEGAFRTQLAETLHAEIWLHFGLSEVPGPAIAFECGRHDGLHIQETHFLAEIIDPATGEVIQDDTPGELVLTTLTTRAFPLIRFRTGEGAAWIADPCSCGCNLRRLRWLPERTDDILNVNGVKVRPDLVMRHLDQVLGYRPASRLFVRHFPFDGVHLELQLAMDDTLFSDEIKRFEFKVNEIRRILVDNLGVEVVVRLVERLEED